MLENVGNELTFFALGNVYRARFTTECGRIHRKVAQGIRSVSSLRTFLITLFFILRKLQILYHFAHRFFSK